MIGNILKIIIFLIVGSLFGLVFGATTGALLGALPGLIFREIILFKQTILMSISLGVFLGGLFGLFSTKLVNRIFEVNNEPLNGAIFGIIVGILVTMRTGIIGNSGLDTSDSFVFLIPVFYSQILGSKIGAIVFSMIGATSIIKSIIEEHNSLKDNKQKLEEVKKSLGIHSSEEKRG